jgi:TetR/AcrR family transcriptional regulator, cholesterol catabolism regulator
MDALHTILNRAKDLFITCGVKTITMDDLARDMGMSKKTLYQYIPTKAKLIERMVQAHIKEEKKAIQEIQARSQNAIEEMVFISHYVLKMLRMVSPKVIFEMKKYYWDSWQKISKLNSDHILDVIRKNIQSGIDQGHYRKEIDPDIIAQHYVTLSNSLVDLDTFPGPILNMEKLYLETLRYHLRGITTSEGWTLYQKINHKLDT